MAVPLLIGSREWEKARSWVGMVELWEPVGREKKAILSGRQGKVVLVW